MDNVHYFGQIFKEDDFNHVFYDNRQIVMFTDFISPRDAKLGTEPVRMVLFFTRTEEGTPKVLGMKFCSPEGDTSLNCFEADPNKRDSDQNGWWDQVEALFIKKT